MWAGMDRGQLEARTAAAERAQATAPPDVAGELRRTAHAEADAPQQAADAQVRNQPPKPPAPAHSPTSSPPDASNSSRQRGVRGMG